MLFRSNGRKSSGDVLGLETSSGPSKGRVRSQRRKDARVLKPGQMLVVKIQSFQPVTRLQSGNTHADSLAMLATSSVGGLPRIVLVEHLDRANKEARSISMSLEWVLAGWTLQ